MNTCLVFKKPEGGFCAVKQGFSWPAFLFPPIWALRSQLWLRGLSLVGFYVALGWFAAVTWDQNHLFPLGISLLIQLIVGAKGSNWRSIALEDRGFRYLGAINARDPEDAEAKITATNGVITEELKAHSRVAGLFSVPASVQGILAMSTLTWKAAFRYKLFWVLSVLLLGSVVGLPLLLKDDGTVEGFTQILLTYTLSAVTGLLGLCTLWLACGTLARDIEECQIQMVVVKPIARWQIWLGKWLGLVSLNAALLGLSGLGIFGLLEWRAKQLPVEQQARLFNEILVARASVKEANRESYIEEYTDKELVEREKKSLLENVNKADARKMLREQVKAAFESVGPDGGRGWILHVGAATNYLKGQPLFIRVKFNTLDMSEFGTFGADFVVGTPQETSQIWVSPRMSLAPNAFHEFVIPPDMFDKNGDVRILYHNPNNVALVFPLDEGMELLYREGGFGMNYVRGLGIILCWMTLFATLGLAAASFLSFPVAAFFSLAVLTLGLSSGTLSNVVSEGTLMGFNEESGKLGHSSLDLVAVPVFHGMLSVIQLVQQFSPIDALSSGRSISWTQVARAFAQVVFLIGGFLATVGIVIFSRREMATAQGTS